MLLAREEIAVGRLAINEVNEFAAHVGISPIAAQIMLNRQISDPEQAKNWLEGSAEALHDPLLLPDIKKACALIEQAISQKQLIYLCGDYDCDGVCAVTILMIGLRQLGAVVEYRVPDRFTEGFGLSTQEVEEAHLAKAALIVTVDCGSSSTESIALAKSYGLSVIVTDHHILDCDLPPADAVVNAHREDSRYPFRDLCGGAIAWKLLCALCQLRGLPRPMELLDLVALCSISDMVNLVGENRLVTQLGLALLSKLERPGIKALADVSKVIPGFKDVIPVAYLLTPRINATGRLRSAALAVDLLLETDPVLCKSKAELVAKINDERKQLEKELTDEVLPHLIEAFNSEQPPSFIFEVGNWHRGVVGIAANKLLHRFRVPVIVGAIEGATVAASGRALDGTNLYSILTRMQGTLLHFGGHEKAGGMGFSLDRLEEVKASFAQAVAELSGSRVPKRVEFELPLHLVTTELAKDLLRLEPTGKKNPLPLFYASHVHLRNARLVGKDKCLMASFYQSCPRKTEGIAVPPPQNGEQLAVSGFISGIDELEQALDLDTTALDIVYSVSLNVWRGKEEARIKIEEIMAPCDQAAISLALPPAEYEKQQAVLLTAQEPGLKPEQENETAPEPASANLPASLPVASGGSCPQQPAYVSCLGSGLFKLSKRIVDARNVLSLHNYCRNLQRTGQVIALVATPEQAKYYDRQINLSGVTCYLAKDLSKLSEQYGQAVEHVLLLAPPFSADIFTAPLVRQASHLHVAFGEQEWLEHRKVLNSYYLDNHRVGLVYKELVAIMQKNRVTALALKQFCSSIAHRLHLEASVVKNAYTVLCDIGVLRWSKADGGEAAFLAYDTGERKKYKLEDSALFCRLQQLPDCSRELYAALGGISLVIPEEWK